MQLSGAKSSPAFGFLTVIERQGQGVCGGYLVLNAAGRPLEFHCTAPVKTTRAQEILYGATLEPFLYGEQIGQTLLSKGTIEPAVVWTDVLPALAVREFISAPVVLVGGDDSASGEAGGTRLLRFEAGEQELAIPFEHRDDQPAIEEYVRSYLASADLLEPFGRIREAIDEAQKARS